MISVLCKSSKTNEGINILFIFCNIKTNKIKYLYFHGYCSEKYDSSTVRFKILITLTLVYELHAQMPIFWKNI